MPSLNDYTSVIKRFGNIFCQNPNLIIEDKPIQSQFCVRLVLSYSIFNGMGGMM